MRRRLVVVSALAILSIRSIAAQTGSSAQLSRERLNYFEGTWSIEMHMNTGALNSRAYFTTEHNEWVSDHSLLLSRSDHDEALSAGGLVVMGYSAAKNVYAYHIVKSNGEAEDLKGTVDGKTWIWTSDGARPGEQVPWTRITMKEISSMLYTLRVETSLEGSTWSTVMDGTARKVLPHPHQDVAFLR
jgi:hypothetical protein